MSAPRLSDKGKQGDYRPCCCTAKGTSISVYLWCFFKASDSRSCALVERAICLVCDSVKAGSLDSKPLREFVAS